MQNSSFKIWILAARPKTLWAAIAPVIIGCAMAYEAGGFHLLSALTALWGAIMIQIGTNFANDYFDNKKGVDQPDRLGPTRATQAGWVTPKQIKIATIFVFSLAFIAGIYLVFRGGLPIVIIGFLSILFGVLYTGGPFPLGYIGLADIFVLIFFGPVAVGGTYYVQTLSINPVIIISGLAPGFFSVAILTVNNYRDLESDKKSGRKTLAVRFGATFSKLEYLLSVFLACMIPVYLSFQRNNYAIFIGGIIVFVMALIPIWKVFTCIGKDLNDVLASTGKLLFLYSIIFTIGWLL